MRYALVAAVAACALSAPGPAAVLTFGGAGTVERAGGRLVPTGTAPIGSALKFNFDFDLAAASLYEADEGYAVYDLPVSNFNASLGGYAFALNGDPAFVPVLELSRGFSFFGGSSSDPVLSLTFYLPGAFLNAGSTSTPFPLSAGSRDNLALTATFRTKGTDAGVGLDQVMNPAQADRLDFVYSARDLATRQTGLLLGGFTGGFNSASAVPEPTTWAMMIGGIAAIGGSMRFRRNRKSGYVIAS